MKGHLKQNSREQKPKCKADSLRDLSSGSAVNMLPTRGGAVGVAGAGMDSWSGLFFKNQEYLLK